jgi:hypothetical protein
MGFLLKLGGQSTGMKAARTCTGWLRNTHSQEYPNPCPHCQHYSDHHLRVKLQAYIQNRHVHNTALGMSLNSAMRRSSRVNVQIPVFSHELLVTLRVDLVVVIPASLCEIYSFIYKRSVQMLLIWEAKDGGFAEIFD